MTFNSNIIAADDIIHLGDADTLISLEDDKIVLQTGGLEMVSIIEAATDEVVINDGQGDINFRIEGNTEENIFVSDAGNDVPIFGHGGLPTDISGSKLIIAGGAGFNYDNVAAGAGTSAFRFNRATGTLDTPATVADGDILGQISVRGHDGTSYNTSSDIKFEVDGALVGVNVPGRAVFNMRAAGGGFNEVMRVISTRRVGINASGPSATLHVDQFSTTGAIPVAFFDQADISEEIIWYSGESAAGSADMSLVDASEFTTPGALLGWIKKKIQDNRGGGGVGTIDAWMPFYAIPTA